MTATGNPSPPSNCSRPTPRTSAPTVSPSFFVVMVLIVVLPYALDASAAPIGRFTQTSPRSPDGAGRSDPAHMRTLIPVPGSS